MVSCKSFVCNTSESPEARICRTRHEQRQSSRQMGWHRAQLGSENGFRNERKTGDAEGATQIYLKRIVSHCYRRSRGISRRGVERILYPGRFRMLQRANRVATLYRLRRAKMETCAGELLVHGRGIIAGFAAERESYVEVGLPAAKEKFNTPTLKNPRVEHPHPRRDTWTMKFWRREAESNRR